jgi:hypothetical protein
VKHLALAAACKPSVLYATLHVRHSKFLVTITKKSCPLQLSWNSILHHVGFEVLTAVSMKITIFWDIARFRRKVSPPSSGFKTSRINGDWATPFLLRSGPYITLIPIDSSFCLATCSRWFLIRLIFNPENGGDTFLRNVGSYTGYTTLFPEDGNF